MFQTRKSSSIKLPIPRKGTKYIARASSHNDNSVSVVLAIRDMLKLAKTANEVKKMIQQKILKINGKPVKEYGESILLFHILEADKSYELSLLPTGKFTLVPVKTKDLRLCKVVNRRLVSSGAMQLNLHDGTNILSKDKINVGDSVYLDFKNKVKKHVPLEKGVEVFIISGKYQGHKGKVKNIQSGKITLELNGNATVLPTQVAVAL